MIWRIDDEGKYRLTYMKHGKQTEKERPLNDYCIKFEFFERKSRISNIV